MASGVIHMGGGGLLFTSETKTNSYGRVTIEWAKQGSVVFVKLTATATTQIGTSMGDFTFTSIPLPSHGFVIPLVGSVSSDYNTKFAQSNGYNNDKMVLIRGAFNNGESGKGTGVYITNE